MAKMAEAAALIGIDVGTTAVKAVMSDAAGRRLADYAAPYPTTRSEAGWVEQDPSDWWFHVEAALTQFAALGRPVAAIGITSQVNTHVFCDAGNLPLRPAIVWQDVRAVESGAELDGRITVEAKTRALGAPIRIDASHALSRMAWVAAAEPEVWVRTRHVLSPKDWVIARLTGVVGADALASVGLVGTDLTYAAPILDLLPRSNDFLPPLQDPRSIAGSVRDGVLAGVPVVRGTMDAWASMFGTGVARNGEAMNLSGTSEVLGLISADHHPEPGVITFPPWAGITLHAGPTQAGGASLEWLGKLMGQSAPDLAARVEGHRITSTSPLFLPHLAGERAPLWDAQARGAFAGLSSAHGPVDMIAAVMEGVAFSARLAVEALERAGGQRASTVRGGGGGTSSDAWCQIRADVLGRPFERMQARDAGAVGAMVIAGVGAGLMADLANATADLVPSDRMFLPDPSGAALADRRFALWQELYQQLRPINAALT